MSRSDAVLSEVREGILLLTINRPGASNAVNVDVTIGIGEALDRAQDDPDIRVVLLTGAGNRAFCAGQDLKESAEGRSVDDRRRERWGFAGFTAHPISTPTIAVVNGVALGGGAELVLAADLAVAADTALIGLPEVRRGIVAGGGGAFRLPRQIPVKFAMEALLTGEPMTAVRALELGLVNRVVPATRLLETAFDLARRVRDNAPLAVRASKRLARGVSATEDPEVDDWRRSRSETRDVMASDDGREGMRAFIEKREPRWRGR
jgi:crotonobetainyl-CoA hydratase